MGCGPPDPSWFGGVLPKLHFRGEVGPGKASARAGVRCQRGQVLGCYTCPLSPARISKMRELSWPLRCQGLCLSHIESYRIGPDSSE